MHNVFLLFLTNSGMLNSNPPGAKVARLRNLRYSRWRTRWMPIINFSLYSSCSYHRMMVLVSKCMFLRSRNPFSMSDEVLGFKMPAKIQYGGYEASIRLYKVLPNFTEIFLLCFEFLLSLTLNVIKSC